MLGEKGKHMVLQPFMGNLEVCDNTLLINKWEDKGNVCHVAILCTIHAQLLIF